MSGGRRGGSGFGPAAKAYSIAGNGEKVFRQA